jgi:PEGA domain
VPVTSKPPAVSKAPVASKPPVQASVAVKRGKATEDVTADAAVPSTSFKGAVGVESSPEGARVFVDRKLVGFTPIVVPDLVAGSHVIRVEADTHESWTSVVRVVADEVTRVTAPLRQPANR